MCAKLTVDQEELQTISNIINPTKNTKLTHYMPVIWGKMKCRLGKAKLKSIRILFNSGDISSIIIGKHMQKMWKEMTKSVRWGTQGAMSLNPKFIVSVQFVPVLHAKIGQFRIRF